MRTSRTDILVSPGFLTSLSLLLINDFYLKSAFNSPFIGKLSDFAGLFAFALFWIALFPRWRRGICLAVAVGFAFWKSSYSQPVVDLWNALGIVQFSRVVDLSDLIALSVLPLAYSYTGRPPSQREAPRWVLVSVALIAVFAFTATSYSTQYDDYENKYYFPWSRVELFDTIDYLHLDYLDVPLSKTERESGKLEVNIPTSICFDSFYAHLEVTEVGNQTVVSIKKLSNHCRRSDGDRGKMLAGFEKEFIERLKNGIPQTKHFKSDVETPGFKPPPIPRPTHLQASPARVPGKS